MPVADLFQLETDFETAFQSILATATGVDVDKSREANDAVTPRIEVKFLPGAVDGKRRHYIDTGSATRFAYSGWFGSQLIIEVITQRQNNGTQHKTLLGKVRSEMQMFKLLDTWPSQDAASRHVPADIRESGSVHSFNSDDDTDTTTVTFSVNHSILDDAEEWG